MKLICSKANLLKGVNIVSKAVPSKTTMSILECILIDASASEIKFTANDMELGIETIVEGEILEKGIVAIDAKVFSEIVRKLPDNDVTIDTDSNYQISITCEKANFHISGKSGEYFSYLPYIEKTDFISLSQLTLKEVIRQTIFEFDNTMVVSRLIEGEYFKINQMLSSDYETKFVINKKELLSCIDRATLLVKEGDKKPIIFRITDEDMEISINSQLGSMKEEIDIQKEGKDILIGFNPKFLIDALRVIDDENITIYMVNPKAPCYIRDDEQKYIYLILPVNFNASAN